MSNNFKAIELIYTNDTRLIIPSEFVKYLDIEFPKTSHQRIFMDFNGNLAEDNNDDLIDSFRLFISVNNKFLKYLKKHHKKYTFNNSKLNKKELFNYWFKRKDVVAYVLHGNYSTLCYKETILPLLYEAKDEYSSNDILNMNKYATYIYGKTDKDEYLFYLYITKNQSDEHKKLSIKNIKTELKKQCNIIKCA
jgi:hypothetical protein